MKTIPRDTPRPTKPLAKLMAGANSHSATTCPACGLAHAFHVTNSYLRTGNPHRLRKCRFCPHVADEPAPKPVISGETSFSREE